MKTQHNINEKQSVNVVTQNNIQGFKITGGEIFG